MRKTLSLPIKSNMSMSIAAYAKTLPAAHPTIPAPPAPPARSKLFDEPEPAQQRTRTARSGHQVEAGTLGQHYPLAPAKGTMNRPDKSEPKVNLTFNWDR